MTRPEDSKAAIAKFDGMTKILNDHLDRLAAAASSPAAQANSRKAKADVMRWEEQARVLLGAAPATSIPAPHAMAQIEVTIRKGLDELVNIALADAKTIQADVESAISFANRLNLILVFAGVVVGVLLAVVCSLALTRPLIRLEATMRELAQGNLEVTVTDKVRTDEIGRMAVALEVFKDSMITGARLRLEQEEAQARAAAERKTAEEREHAAAKGGRAEGRGRAQTRDAETGGRF